MDYATQQYYNENADEVTRRYESVTGGVASFFPFVFTSGERVLDIGAGTGRDAASLLKLGVHVHAIEPSLELRQRARALHPELAGKLFDGALPDRLAPETLSEKYDGIVLSAVIMHIPDAELFEAAFVLRECLKERGKLLISMPVTRGDVAEGSQRDNLGRLMIMRSASQVRLLFERLGFALQSEWTSSDGAGRPDVLWTTLCLRLSGVSARPIDRVQSILKADRKVATYKFALVRALCDVALTAWPCVRWESGGVVSVAVSDVAQRWVRYYWPLLESETVLPQINAEGRKEGCPHQGVLSRRRRTPTDLAFDELRTLLRGLGYVELRT